MRKCPFCAEEIKDEAIKCKHCGSNLPSVSNEKIENISTEKKQTSVLGVWMPILKTFGYIFLGVIAIAFFYISIPAALLWYLWAKTKLSKKTKIIITVVPLGLFILLYIIVLIVSAITPPPLLSILEPQDGTIVISKSILIDGKVEPTDVEVKINGEEVTDIDETTGNFSFQYDKLVLGKNEIKMNYNNLHDSKELIITITRNTTPEEQAELDKQAAEAEVKRKAEEEAAEKAKAEAEKKANEPDGISLIRCATDRVRSILKSPSTAKFPSVVWDSSSYGISKTSAEEYQISGYVDAQNSFGAMLRNNFICTVQMESKDADCYAGCQLLE